MLPFLKLYFKSGRIREGRRILTTTSTNPINNLNNYCIHTNGYFIIFQILAQMFFMCSLSPMMARRAVSPSTFRFECSHSRMYPPPAYFSSMCWYARSKCHSKSTSGSSFIPNCNVHLRMVSGLVSREY